MGGRVGGGPVRQGSAAPDPHSASHIDDLGFAGRKNPC